MSDERENPPPPAAPPAPEPRVSDEDAPGSGTNEHKDEASDDESNNDGPEATDPADPTIPGNPVDRLAKLKQDLIEAQREIKFIIRSKRRT